MAKKVKKEKIKDDVPETTPLIYEGYVTITQKYKKQILNKKIIKNIGTNRLFKGLGLLLTDSNLSDLNTFKPNYIACGKGIVGSGFTEDTTGLYGEIPGTRTKILNKKFNENPNSAVFIATIDGSNLIGLDITNIGLFGTGNSNTLLAGIDTTDKIETITSASITLIIE